MKNDVTPIPAIKQQCPNANKRMSCISQLVALPALFGKAQKPSGFEFVSWAEVQKCFMSSRGWMARKWSTIKWLSPLPGRITWSRLKTDKIPYPPTFVFLCLLFCVCAQVCGCAYVCKRQRYRETDRQTQTDRVHSHTPWWQLTVASGAIRAGAGDHHDISWLTFEVWLWSVLSGEALNVYWSVSPQSSWRQARDLLGP